MEFDSMSKRNMSSESFSLNGSWWGDDSPVLKAEEYMIFGFFVGGFEDDFDRSEEVYIYTQTVGEGFLDDGRKTGEVSKKQ